MEKPLLLRLSWTLPQYFRGQAVEHHFAIDHENGLAYRLVLDKGDLHRWIYSAAIDDLSGPWEPWQITPTLVEGAEWTFVDSTGSEAPQPQPQPQPQLSEEED